MPVEFLTDEQAARYGQFDGNPTPEQLAQYFTLSEQDHALVAQRRRKHNTLGFEVQLCTLRFLGTFLTDPLRVPLVAVKHVAQQLRLPVKVFSKYGRREETRGEHQRLIRDYLAYQTFNGFQAVRLIRWLFAQLALGNPRPIELFDGATAYLEKHRIILPGVTVLARLIARVRERHAVRTFEGLSQRLTDH
ncbi:DUF4158 domain-containing protein [Deinococcus sp. HMF7604]|uniref:DUF4158 domain-containing protein n=1 Tax=Deinococcus betulae TaxID=2873312 RepID=UPI001CCB39BE|nr:DUF4158 domain-containing protein [Deinococcus betulae]MBZ9749779.1 DUF4158 domain-containing protein [Deinococcus betulae]